MNFLMMMWRHADPVRDLLDFATTWSVATLWWVVPPLGLCAIVWRAPAAAREAPAPPAVPAP